MQSCFMKLKFPAIMENLFIVLEILWLTMLDFGIVMLQFMLFLLTRITPGTKENTMFPTDGCCT